MAEQELQGPGYGPFSALESIAPEVAEMIKASLTAEPTYEVRGGIGKGLTAGLFNAIGSIFNNPDLGGELFGTQTNRVDTGTLASLLLNAADLQGERERFDRAIALEEKLAKAQMEHDTKKTLSQQAHEIELQKNGIEAATELEAQRHGYSKDLARLNVIHEAAQSERLHSQRMEEAAVNYRNLSKLERDRFLREKGSWFMQALLDYGYRRHALKVERDLAQSKQDHQSRENAEDRKLARETTDKTLASKSASESSDTRADVTTQLNATALAGSVVDEKRAESGGADLFTSDIMNTALYSGEAITEEGLNAITDQVTQFWQQSGYDENTDPNEIMKSLRDAVAAQMTPIKLRAGQLTTTAASEGGNMDNIGAGTAYLREAVDRKTTHILQQAPAIISKLQVLGRAKSIGSMLSTEINNTGPGNLGMDYNMSPYEYGQKMQPYHNAEDVNSPYKWPKGIREPANASVRAVNSLNMDSTPAEIQEALGLVKHWHDYVNL